MTGRRWRLLDADPTRTAAAASRHGLPTLAARCLVRRTPTDLEDRWLRPSIEHLHDPYAMTGMAAAVERIRRAVGERQRVRIVTDYDVDGTTSSLILQSAIRLLGSDAVDYHIPDRFDEGYGFSLRAAERAVADGIALIITADIGVRDYEAVARAAAGGVDVIVCDHHLPAGAEVPEAALAVLCPPQRGCDYPNQALAACGVSLKLTQALLDGHPKRDAVVQSMLKVAAIGTVADVVDLSTPENRAIVALGLEGLRTGRHSPGLQALLDVAGLRDGRIVESDLGFRLGPRINAAGRLESATAVIDLFAERNPERALERAMALDQLNRARQGLQRTLLQKCVAQIGEQSPSFAVHWGAESDGWHRGVVGIVAAKIRDRLHRPAAVVAVSGDEARGSVRSVPGVHAVAALEAVADLLTRFGGHAAAAGFSARVADLPAIASGLAEHVRQHADDDALVPTLELEGRCGPPQVDASLVDALDRLGPFGKGNPRPLLLVEAAHVGDARRMGDRHARFRVGPLDAVWWGGAGHVDRIGGPMQLAARPELNHYNGRTTVRLVVEDARTAAVEG